MEILGHSQIAVTMNLHPRIRRQQAGGDEPYGPATAAAPTGVRDYRQSPRSSSLRGLAGEHVLFDYASALHIEHEANHSTGLSIAQSARLTSGLGSKDRA